MKLTLFIGVLLWGTDASSQSEPCGLGVTMTSAASHNPDYEEKIKAYNQRALINLSGSHVGGDTEYVIPTVVHIIHNNGAENISDEQIHNAIEQANLQFAGGEGGYDTGISFRLATIDPLGNCTKGIVRVSSPLTNVTSLDYVDDVALKNLSRWNPEQYMNIWVVNELPGITGAYSYLPPVDSDIDGIVVQDDFFGESGTASGNIFNLLTHEIGHYLSLLHVWGRDFISVDEDWCETHCHALEDSHIHGDLVEDTNPCFGQYILAPGQVEDCGPLITTCSDCPINTMLPFPKENYLSYTWQCQDRLTEGQAERMYFALTDLRSFLWSEENKGCTGLNNIGNDLVIASDETWTTESTINQGDITISGDLTIESGATLTIDSDVIVRFCGNSKLVVKTNANLILSGTLTNSCGEYWKGVEVWGDGSVSQYTIGGVRPQGRIVGLPGSVIENAEIGVQLWGPSYEDTGGQINCNGTNFINNHVAVEFASFENTWPFPFPIGWQNQPRNYFGAFSKCAFETNDAYSHSLIFKAFVDMIGVNGIRFSGCTFQNNQTTTTGLTIDDRGYGIKATDSGIRVEPLCEVNTNPCTSFTRSSFDGLGYGIYVANIIGNKPYTVTQSDFSGCYVGLYNSAVTGATILFNDFSLGTIPDPSIMPDQIGIEFENNISGFTCQENTFTGQSGNAINTIGILCKNIGIFNNVIRKNTFEGLDYGNVSNGVHGHNVDRGLHYLCNYNNNISEADIAVPAIAEFGDRIRIEQGLEQIDENNNPYYAAAGNRFSYLGNSLYNEGNFLKYHYFGTINDDTNQYPQSSFGAVPLEAEYNPCPESYCEPPCRTREEIEEEKENYYSYSSKQLEALNVQSVALASGNTSLADKKGKEAGYYKQRMDESAYMVVVHLMHDTLFYDSDSLMTWINNLDAFGVDMNRALFHQINGNLLEVQAFLQKVSEREDLTIQQQEDLALMPELLSLFKTKTPYNLDNKDLAVLERLAVYDESYIGNVSRNILRVYGYEFPLTYRLPKSKAHVFEVDGKANVSPKKEVALYPNPSAGNFTLSWYPIDENRVEEANMTIMDASGKIVKSFTIDSFKDNQISCNDLQTGVYFYQILISNKSLYRGKFVIQ